MEELKPPFIKIEPKPQWEEEPIKTETPREWVGRYRYLRQGNNGEPEVDVDVDVHYAPENYPEAMPIEINGEWFWDTEQRSKHGRT